MTARHRAMLAIVGLTLLLAGCDSNVGGSPQSGGSPTTGAAGSSGPSRWLTNAALERLPAASTTLSSISLLDGATMNKVAQRVGFSDSSKDSSGRPDSERAWLDAAAVDNPCGQKLDSSAGGLRTGPPGDSTEVELGTNDRHGYLAICAPAATAGKLSDAKARGAQVAATSFAGRRGFAAAGSEWMGNDSGNTVTYIAESNTPADLAMVVVGNKAPAASGTLVKNFDVLAVLTAAPAAAMIEMGSTLVATSPFSAPAAVSTAFKQAVAKGGYGEPPVPEFGGYAWTPGARINGTATFVTSYGSKEEAGTESAILKDVWSRLGDSKFVGAVTTQDGRTVITRIADVGPTEFKVQSGQLGDYPAFLARS